MADVPECEAHPFVDAEEISKKQTLAQLPGSVSEKQTRQGNLLGFHATLQYRYRRPRR